MVTTGVLTVGFSKTVVETVMLRVVVKSRYWLLVKLHVADVESKKKLGLLLR